MHARQYILLKRAHELDPSDPDVRKTWMETLPIGEHIKSLEDYLTQPGNDDPETRGRLTEQLKFLRATQSERSGRCRAVSDVTATQTNLVPVQSRNGNIQGSGLDVAINGKVLRLLLDTGASGILISSKLASQAGLKTVSAVRLGGVGDKPDFQAHVGSADSVRIGAMEFSNCPVYVVDRFAEGEDGIIGTDVFSQFLIEIDFPSGMLRLSALPFRRRPVRRLRGHGLRDTLTATSRPRCIPTFRPSASDTCCWCQPRSMTVPRNYSFWTPGRSTTRSLPPRPRKSQRCTAHLRLGFMGSKGT